MRNPVLIPFLTLAFAAISGPAGGQVNRAPAARPAPVVPPAPQARPAPVQAARIPDIPRATFISQMDAEHRKRDGDGDGKVTRAELERWERSQMLAQAQANNQALFSRLDADRNGVLSPGEFSALVQDPGTPDVGPLMIRFDGNRDQVITLIEYRAATLVNFDKLDVDKDGVLTGAEMQAVPAVRQQGR